MKINAIFCLCLALLLLGGCTKPLNMNTVLDEPHFIGTVTEVRENSILVMVDDGEAVREIADLMEVSLDVELADGKTPMNVGDTVCVYYDGAIAESYPAQVSKVYAITVCQAASTELDFADIESGMSREDIHAAFGEPAGTLSGMYGDIYVGGDSRRIIIYYDEDSKVAEIKIDAGEIGEQLDGSDYEH